jgi:tetratricopeptide (TPR) repeat protein
MMGRFLVTVLLAGIAAGAHAADEAGVLRLRAEQLAAADRCEEALPRARQARALAPGDARAALVEGRCALRLNRYEAAIEPLQKAREIDPTLPGVSIDLVIAYYHSDFKEAARNELATAELETPDDARVSLYRGLFLLEGAEVAEAAAAFERAGQLDADLDPVASYYAGLAWQQEADRERAQAALERVREQAPDSAWATQADLALQRLDQPYLPHRWAKAQLGLDYDSNVVLKGQGVVLPAEISDQEDGRGYWSMDLGWEFHRNPTWSFGVLPAYYGDANFDLSQFNLQYPSLSGWIDRRVDEVSFVRLRPYGGYAWRDNDPYVGLGGAETSYNRSFGSLGVGRAYVDVSYQDYHFAIPDDQGILGALPFFAASGLTVTQAQLDALNEAVKDERVRDGTDLTAGYEHTLPLASDTPLETTVRAGVAGGRYFSEGREYEHSSVKVWLRARKALFFETTIDVLGSFAYEPYAYPSTFLPIEEQFSCVGSSCVVRASGDDREDNIFNVRVILERPITDTIKGSVRWRFQDNQSNTDAYDYHRHIVGGYLTFYYGG